MWLDEILQTRQASAPLVELLGQLRGDEHPPLDAILSAMLLRAGLDETQRRLVPVLFGILAVIALAGLAARLFGRRTGWCCGLLAAASPLHVQYSQELRPYSLATLLGVLSAVAALRALERRRTRDLLLAATACCAAISTHYLVALVLLPFGLLGVAWWKGASACERSELVSSGRRAALGVAALAALAVPLLWRAFELREREVQARALRWSVDEIARRLQRLTIGGVEGAVVEPATVLVAVCVAVGAWRAVRKGVGGRTVALAALSGTVGVELLLVAVDRWTNSRYDLFGWPWLTVLLALGVEAFSILPGIRRGVFASLVAGAVLFVLVAAQGRGIFDYLLGGRPDWRRAAQGLVQMAGPGDRLLVSNEWTRVSLLHYLEGSGEHELARRLEIVGRSRAPGESWPEGEGATLVGVGGWPEHRELASWLGATPPVWEIPATVQFFVLPPDRIATHAQRLSFEVRRRRSVLEKVLPWWPQSQAERLSLSVDDRERWLFGLAEIERTPEGTHFAWVEGTATEAAMMVRTPRALVVDVKLWPLPVPGRKQGFRLQVNQRTVRELELEEGLQSVRTQVPAAVWRQGENRLRIDLAHAVAPRDVDARSNDSRSLSVAITAVGIEEVD